MPPSIGAVIGSASDTPVVEAGAKRIGVLETQWPLLPSTSNVIENKIIGFVSSISSNPVSGSAADELAEYLALSACCHSLDGWRYISQAATAVLSGARNQALHLAYYAELRAALSILANSGIGILLNKHFAITSSNGITWFNGTTHKMTWQALQEWSKLAPQAMSVVECFQALGVSGSDWAEACSATATTDAIAQSWLADWSVDISTLEADSLRRNEATYRPDLKPDALKQVDKQDVEYIKETCALFGADGAGTFEQIDLILISDLCRKACVLKFGSDSHADMRKLLNEVFKWLCRHGGKSRRDAARMVRAIKQSLPGAGIHILKTADTTNTTALGVMSRALLLLRLAGAITRRQWARMRAVSAGGVSRWQEELIAAYGLSANLWSEASPPTDYVFLEDDRLAAQEALEIWLTGAARFSARKMWSEIAKDLLELCRLERTGLLAIA